MAKTELVTADFNYGSVDTDTAKKLEYYAKAGKALICKSQIQFIADMGKLLSEAREVMSKHGDGKFIKWATAEFDVSKDTIYRYVKAWDKCLSHGATNYMNWTPTAVYLASSDDIPVPVFKKLERLPSVGTIRSSDVKRVIEASKPKPKPLDVTPPVSVADPVGGTNLADAIESDGEAEFDADQNDDVPFDSVSAAPEPPQACIMLDTIGKQIPAHLREASELAIQLQSTGRELDKYRKIANEFASQPGGEWLHLQSIDDAVRTLKGLFQGAQYHTVCPRCDGKGCQRCNEHGYLPEHRKNIL